MSHIQIGWNEWVSLPNLKIPAIKAKIDTGAQTSALHAFDIEPFSKNGRDMVRFSVHPLQANNELTVRSIAPVIDMRHIMSSNGHRELRYVISSAIELADRQWEIELTLSNRDPLKFRMLLGREALKHDIVIHPNQQCHNGKVSKNDLRSIYSL